MKHRALIVGAGRIGAGFNWHDDAYTHAGAYRALPERVELVAFVEPDPIRRQAAADKWGVPGLEKLEHAWDFDRFDIVSICTQPDDQYGAVIACLKAGVKGIYCEKPYMGPRVDTGIPIQVNYMRRGSEYHRKIASDKYDSHNSWTLYVYGKDDIHTKCHFEDLAKFWDVELDYRVFNGPCAYILKNHASGDTWFFDNGGVDGGECMKAMLGNLLDVIDGVKNKYGDETYLWSPHV